MMKLTQFELSKIGKNRTVMGALVVSLFILFGIFYVGYHYSQENFSARDNVEAGYPAKLDKSIKEKYSGDLTDEKVKEIVSDYMEIWQDAKTDSALVFYPFYWDIQSTFIPRKNYDLFLVMLDKLENGQRLSVEEVPIKKIDDNDFQNFDKPLQLGNYVPWTDLYKVVGNLYILISVLVALVCSLVFSDDTSRNMNQILFTTKYGKSKSLISKLLAGISASTCLFVAIHIINFITFALMNDISGWKSSIQTNFAMKLSDFPMEWNHLQVFLCIIGLQFLGILFVAATSVLVSSFVKTPLSSFATATGLYLLPALLMQAFKGNIVSKYLYFFPINQANVKNILVLLSSEGDFFRTSVVSNLLLLSLFLLVSYVFFNFIAYRRMKVWRF